jgi:hypothetical protein
MDLKKCILIDVKNETIGEIFIGEGIQPIYETVGCEMFECVDVDDVNTIYVDEEGLLKLNHDTKFFTIEGGHQPFAGNGLVMGTDMETGESIDTTLSVEYLKEKIKFHTMSEVRSMM